MKSFNIFGWKITLERLEDIQWRSIDILLLRRKRIPAIKFHYDHSEELYDIPKALKTSKERVDAREVILMDKGFLVQTSSYSPQFINYETTDLGKETLKKYQR
jgi:hypothetical protein